MNSITPVLQVPRTSFVSLDDPRLSSAWEFPVLANLSFADGSPAPPHLRTEIRLFWTEDSLFVLYDAAFSRLRQTPATHPVEPSGKTLNLWEMSDVLECFIGPNALATSRYKEFQVAPDGRWIDIAIDRRIDPNASDATWISGGRFTSVIDDARRTWRAAMQLPWRSLDVIPVLGTILECNFYRATGTYHGDELLAWSPTGYGEACFHRVDKFGVIELAGREG